MPGKARAEEKRIAGKTPTVHGGWAQNDPQVCLDTLVSAIKRKIAIAEQRDFEGLGLAELWLLVCSGTPEHDAVISTMVMTPLLHAHNIEAAIGHDLQKSKYDRCLFLPVLGAEQAFYRWEKNAAWKKAVLLNDINDVPRASYTESLMSAAAAGDDQELDRLCDEEVKAVLHELRQSDRLAASIIGRHDNRCASIHAPRNGNVQRGHRSHPEDGQTSDLARC